MSRSTLVFAIAIPVFVSVQASAAQHGHAAAPKPNTHAAAGPKTTTATHGHAAAPKPAKTTVSHGTHATKTTVHGSSHASVKTTTAKAPKVKSTTTTTASTATTRNGKTTTTTGTTTATLSPAQQKLQRNTNLASKLQSRLPAGTDLMAASAGFRNLGQFVAAVNVSNNLGIPFSELKTRMVTNGMSLGQAIQDTRPRTNDTTTIVRRAETDADVMIRSTATTTTTSKNKTNKTNKKNGQR
jgi:hypothetical protein